MKTLLVAMLSFVALYSVDLWGAEAIEWEPYMELGNDIYPSLLISTATVHWNDPEAEPDPDEVEILGDKDGWFGVDIANVPAGARIVVEVTGDGWLKPSKFQGRADEEAEELSVNPKMLYNFDLLHTIRQQKPVNLTFKVSVNGKDLGEKTETLVMHPVNDCPFLVDKGEEEDPLDLSWMFAAYVNENHPWIDGLLKEALQLGLVTSFTGYQSDDPDVVLAQVFAIWHVLQRKGIKYSDITTTPGAKSVASQTVRFLDDSVKATQANCVDGSVLMASILRKIGLDVHLVLVPGHCFLAFHAESPDKDDAALIGLETTMLGADDLKPIHQARKLPAKAQKKEFESSSKTFLAAIDMATAVIEKNVEKFEDEEEGAYQLISLAEARAFGIMPIASGTSGK